MLRYKDNIAEVFCDQYLIITINVFHNENKNILQLLKNNKVVQYSGFNLTCISLMQVLKEICIFMPDPVSDVNLDLGHTSFANISDTTFYHNISMLNLYHISYFLL